MKYLITFLLLAFLLACTKKQDDEPTMDPPVITTGIWRIVPVGLPTDSFRYLIDSSVDTVDAFWLAGRVSDGPVEYQTRLGNWYALVYLYPIPPDSYIVANHVDTTIVMNIIDSIPATVMN